MKKALLAAAFLCLASALPTAAAQGPYVGLAGGLAIFHDSDIDVRVPGFGTVSGEVEYDIGYGFNVSAGYKFDQMRLEAEFGYNKADVDKISTAGVTESATGDVTIMSYMINAYYDMKLAAPITPFFGVGLGMINGDLEDEEDTVFGYQLTAGVTSPINEFLNLDVYYRYQGASDFEADAAGMPVDFSYDSSLVFAGLRYTFF